MAMVSAERYLARSGEVPTGGKMKYGARNKIEGVVRKIKKGGVMAQVDLDVDEPVSMSSVLTADSLKDLGLKKGDRVRVIVKAIHVLLVKG
jgi:molybdopterin-binding protein